MAPSVVSDVYMELTRSRFTLENNPVYNKPVYCLFKSLVSKSQLSSDWLNFGSHFLLSALEIKRWKKLHKLILSKNTDIHTKMFMLP